MRQHKLTLLIILVFLFESGALIITGQNPFDEQQDNVLNVDRIPSDTTIVFDTGTESAFPFLATPFLPIALLMLSLLLMPRPVVQAAVQVIVPVIVPTPVPTAVQATQIRDISQLPTAAEKSSELFGTEEPSTIYSTLAPVPPCVPTSCPEGYTISNDLTASINCYFFGGDDEQTWTNALNICRKKGAYLWAPNTVAEAAAVKSTTGFGNNVDIWTGLYSPTSDENFEFVDAGGAFTLDTLPFGERDAIDNDDCVEFELTNSNNWNWDDDPCDRAQQYMCEFPMNVYPEAFTYLKEGKGPGFKNARDAVIKISNKLLQGICFSKFGMVTCCKTDATNTMGIKPNAEIPVIESLRVAVISNHVDLAAELWSQCENPLLTALVAHTYLIALADKAESLYEEELNKNLISHSRKFLSRAIKLLDKLFQKDEDMASKALDYTSEVWGLEEKPLHFGHQFNLEEFISHPSAQKDASKRLFPYESTQQRSNIDTKKNKNISRECTSFVKHHLHWKSTWKFVTAPIIKLVVNVVFFILALVLFSFFLTRDLNTKISVLEVMLFFYMVGDLLEELWSMVRPQDGNWSPQRIFLYLFNLWNMLDLFCIILYIAGFALHYFDPAMLTHTRRLYSIALFIMFLRLLNVLLLIKRIGIIIIMIKEMLVDLVEYLVILILFMLAAGIVYQANIYPNHTVTAFPRNIWDWQIWSILKIPYWQVYGELYLDIIEGSDDTGCTNNATLWNNDPSIKRCPTSDLIPPVIAATYMMLTNWLLLNIVIAMFSARFDLIKEKSSQKWRFHRHSVVIEYEHKIPSPLNIPFRALTILCLVPCFVCSSCKENDIIGTNYQVLLNTQREFAKDIIGRERDGDHLK